MAPISLSQIEAARGTIVGLAVRTPLVPSTCLSDLAGHEFPLTPEIAEPLGAFELRAAGTVSVPEWFSFPRPQDKDYGRLPK